MTNLTFSLPFRFSECVRSHEGCASERLQFCQCIEGFRATTGHVCKKEVRLGDKCGNDTWCVDEFTECNEETMQCDCVLGYKPLPNAKVPRCVFKFVTANYGDSCSGFLDCDFTQECANGTCQCLDGYKYDEKIDNCIEIGIGDSCDSDTDCMGVRGSACKNSTCQCADGYTEHDASLVGKNTKLCLLTEGGEPVVEVGQNCNEPFKAIENKPIAYCQANATCKTCPGYLYIPFEKACVANPVRVYLISFVIKVFKIAF